MAETAHNTAALARATLEAMIETLIEALDRVDGDSDLEPDNDPEDGGDREQDILDEPHDDDELDQDNWSGDAGPGLQFDGSGYEAGQALLHNIHRRYIPKPRRRVTNDAGLPPEFMPLSPAI